MNRLQAEFRRLYLPLSPDGRTHDFGETGLIGSEGRMRAMVLGLARPADWQALSALWKGVQVDLELPAPAIAVNGVDGYQLWFSLAEPVPVAQAHAFLEALRQRYLGNIALDRLAMRPSGATWAPSQAQPPPGVPACQAETGHWSAFVAPDLAAVFSEDPWLDVPPNPEGQADLLSRVAITQPAAFRRALTQLEPASMPAASGAPGSKIDPHDADRVAAGQGLDPRRFLLAVMNDPAVELHLRIEAAKALLPGFEDLRRG